jgi:hypothetical protein
MLKNIKKKNILKVESGLVDILISNGTTEPTNYPYIVDTSDNSLQEHMNATGLAVAATADG